MDNAIRIKSKTVLGGTSRNRSKIFKIRNKTK